MFRDNCLSPDIFGCEYQHREEDNLSQKASLSSTLHTQGNKKIRKGHQESLSVLSENTDTLPSFHSSAVHFSTNWSWSGIRPNLILFASLVHQYNQKVSSCARCFSFLQDLIGSHSIIIRIEYFTKSVWKNFHPIHYVITQKTIPHVLLVT